MVHELAVKIREGFTGLEEELSNSLMLAGGFRLAPRASSQAPHNLAAGSPPPEELPDKQNAQLGQCHLSLYLESDMSPFLPYSITSDRSIQVQCGRGLHEGVNTRRQGPLGTI